MLTWSRLDDRGDDSDPSPTLASMGFGIGIGEDKKSRIVVTAVVEGSPASDSGILSGDVILEVNGVRVSSIDEVKSFLANSGSFAELLVHRDEAGRDKRISIGNKSLNVAMSNGSGGSGRNNSNSQDFGRVIRRTALVIGGLFAFSYCMGSLRSHVKQTHASTPTNSAIQSISTSAAGFFLFGAEFLAAEIAWALTGAVSASLGVCFGLVFALLQNLSSTIPEHQPRGSTQKKGDGRFGRWILFVLVGGPFYISVGAAASAIVALFCRPFIGAGFLASATTMTANGAILVAGVFGTSAFLGPCSAP